MAVEMEKCKKCGSENIAYRAEGSGYSCIDCGYEDKPQTNADRIRSMSDLELSNFIKAVHNDGTCREYAVTHGQDFTDMFGNKGVMQLLQSEVKGSE